MKPIFFLCTTVVMLQLLSNKTFAQELEPILQTVYASYKTGLSIRETPNIKAKVLGKIPYGTKIVYNSRETVDSVIATDGMQGYYIKITYNNIKGYILNSYVLPVQPPKASVKIMEDYLKQITDPFGNKLIVKKGKIGFYDSGYELERQLYKNGAVHSTYTAYESSSDEFVLPDLSLQQAYLLLNLIPEFAKILPTDGVMPNASYTYKKGEISYDCKVIKDESKYIYRIGISFEPGGSVTLEIIDLGGQVMISLGWGV